MADTAPAGRWAVRHVPPPARSVVELMRIGTLDAELAATLWVLVEGHVPFIVAAQAPGTGTTTLMTALLDLVAPDVRFVELAGTAETFAWLPQAPELGWRRPRPEDRIDDPRRPDGDPLRPETTVLVVPEFSDRLPSDTWGEPARIAVRAVSIGYGLAATIRADSLEGVLEALGDPPVGASDDECSRLGVVLVLRRVGRGERRIVASHYLRPTARDEHGHVQRLGPAVLATWDDQGGRYEHFGWGITPELALRVGSRAGDFELEVDRRRAILAGLLDAGVVEVDAVRAAIAASRVDPEAATIPR